MFLGFEVHPRKSLHNSHVWTRLQYAPEVADVVAIVVKRFWPEPLRQQEFLACVPLLYSCEVDAPFKMRRVTHLEQLLLPKSPLIHPWLERGTRILGWHRGFYDPPRLS